jgi:hypothetical protein
LESFIVIVRNTFGKDNFKKYFAHKVKVFRLALEADLERVYGVPLRGLLVG